MSAEKDLRPSDAGRGKFAVGSGGSQFEVTAGGLDKASVSPLLCSSRRMAEYKVAWGVLPPGLDQYPLAAITSTIAIVVIGSVVSSRTLTAASSWLRELFGTFGSASALGFLVRVGLVAGPSVVYAITGATSATIGGLSNLTFVSAATGIGSSNLARLM